MPSGFSSVAMPSTNPFVSATCARAPALLEQKVDAAMCAIGHLAPYRRIARKLGNRACGQRLGHHAIGTRGVDIHKCAVGGEHFERVAQTALGVA
jgi:hypothetical protein